MAIRISYRMRVGLAVAGLWSVAIIASCMLTGAGRGPSALRSVFPSAQEIREVPVAENFGPIRKVYVARGRSGPVGYAVEEQVVSRSGPFTIRVIVDSELSVKRVEVLSYRGERGGDVRSPVFLGQFEGKGQGTPIRVGKDIDAATGATLSSRAVAKGVRRAIQFVRDKLSAAR